MIIILQVHKRKILSGSHDQTLRIWDASKLRDDDDDDEELIEVVTSNGNVSSTTLS